MDDCYAAAYPDLYRGHWWWRAREEILLQRIGELLPPDRRPARILDVGCGAGLFFDALEQFGTVEGIESDREAISKAGRWRAQIHEGHLDPSFRPVSRYDLILLLDVIEHIRDPRSVLERAGHLLHDDGRLLVTVPAFNCLWTTHDDLNHHVNRYTAAELRRSIQAAGLIPVTVSYLFPTLVLPKLLVRLKERILPSKPAAPSIPNPRLNAALQRWLQFEFAAARRPPFGTSVIAVARPDSA